MSFQCVLKATREWLGVNRDFDLILEDEDESRLQFSSSRSELSSFFVICPPSGEQWIVGSDIDKVVPHLANAKAYCRDTAQKRIEDLLDCFSKELAVTGDVANKAEDIGKDDDDDDDDDDDTNDGYENYDNDWDEDDAETETHGRMEIDEATKRFANSSNCENSLAVNRLIKDMKNLEKSGREFGIRGAPRGDNLFVWDVQLTDIPEDTKLGKDLKEYAKKYNKEPVIEMEMQFPGDYPMNPPFVRVIRPRFQFLTGHITVGGSICMQSLTKSGWSPSNDIESILVQIRATIMSDSGASLASNASFSYTESEARAAFVRMAEKYGWNP